MSRLLRIFKLFKLLRYLDCLVIWGSRLSKIETIALKHYDPHSALSTVTVDNFEQVEVTDGSQMSEMGASWTQRKLAFKL